MVAKRRKPEEEEEQEEEEENEDSILRDGQSQRVPLFMRDGAINPDLTPSQRAKAMAAQQTEDAVARRFGLRDALQLHRPGFRYNTDCAALERSRQAYADADQQAANAWKRDATGTFRGQQEGDLCTINGAPGHLRKVNGKFECVPDRSQDAAAFDAKAQAYEQYDREMANAWRGLNR